MAIELIILIIFIVSLAVVLIIMAYKIPALNSLPQNGTTGIKKHKFILAIENKVKGVFIFFEKQIIFHKFLSWVKVMTLRIETKVDHLLHKIRHKNNLPA
ncbi:MAG: hypothetical protein NTY04_02215 [Candidatus Staskawiczbacteria bacterium]|nr:hypothetical protein [Candidatus Staskawiczbacteria bacterium]